MNDPFRTIKIRTKLLLKERGMSQISFARDVLDKNQSNTNKRLNENRPDRFTMEEVLKTAEYFGVTVDWLCGKTDQRNANSSNTIQDVFSFPEEKNKTSIAFNLKDFLIYFAWLMKNGQISIQDSPFVKKEIVYNYIGTDEYGEDHWSPSTAEVTYNSLFFPSFWNPEESHDKENARSDAMEAGNRNAGYYINLLIGFLLKYMPDYAQGNIKDEVFEAMVGDYINKLLSS